jgi:NAD(P)-dependent dehydrogenase (short-subunit alcohol dehydrogenase family)
MRQTVRHPTHHAQRELEDKVAIVTGASRGIGAATAEAFAGAGAAVVLTSRSEDELTTLAEQITRDGGQALAVTNDVADSEGMRRVVERTLDAYGRLDIAFNNAGDGHQPTPLAELSLEEFDRVLSTNARGIFISMKYEIPAMLEAGGGAIVNMSSTAGLRGARGIAAYVAGKHAIIGLTETGALDYGERGIRVNALAPGPIATHRLAQLSDEIRGGIAARLPLRRLGEPHEVAATVRWLCSDEASFISGTTITIDGGKLAGGA